MRKLIFVLLALVLVSCYSPADVETDPNRPEGYYRVRCTKVNEVSIVRFFGELSPNVYDSSKGLAFIYGSDVEIGDTIVKYLPKGIKYRVAYRNFKDLSSSIRTINSFDLVSDTFIVF